MRHLKILFTKQLNPQYKIQIFLIFKIIAGKKVAITNDKKSKDCKINGLKNLVGTKIPTKILFEKSGAGNSKNPAISPDKIDA